MFSIVWSQACYWKAEYNQQQNKLLSEMKTLKEKRNRANSCSCLLVSQSAAQERRACNSTELCTGILTGCQERHQVNSRSELFCSGGTAEKEKLKEKGKSLIKFIQAFAYWTGAFNSSDNMAMQIGVQASESCLSPPCKQAEHHNPALGNVMLLVLVHWVGFFTLCWSPFPHIPSPQQCTRTLMTRVSTREGTGREDTDDLPRLSGHKSQQNTERCG